MSNYNETFEDIVCKTSLEFDFLDKEFDNSYGLAQGPSFTIWTDYRVYFPVQYDGSEWCGSVPRHPCEEVVRHIGGG